MQFEQEANHNTSTWIGERMLKQWWQVHRATYIVVVYSCPSTCLVSGLYQHSFCLRIFISLRLHGHETALLFGIKSIIHCFYSILQRIFFRTAALQTRFIFLRFWSNCINYHSRICFIVQPGFSNEHPLVHSITDLRVFPDFYFGVYFL